VKLEYNECLLKIDELELVLEHPISVAVTDGERAFVIFDYMAFPPEYQAKNLVCFNNAGREIWCAENPLHQSSSAYANFVEVSPQLVVGNFAGWEMCINKDSGKVQGLKWTK